MVQRNLYMRRFGHTVSLKICLGFKRICTDVPTAYAAKLYKYAVKAMHLKARKGKCFRLQGIISD